jgi:hypothetical protein
LPEPTATPFSTATPNPTFDPTADSVTTSVMNLFQQKCAFCHGPGGLNRGGFSSIMDVDAMVSSGKIVVGNPNASRLYQRIDDNSMPPSSSGLPANEKTLIYNWILTVLPERFNPNATPTPVSYQCNPSADPTITPLKRLSKTQYARTIRTLLNPVGHSIANNIFERLQSALLQIPDDLFQDENGRGFNRQDNIVQLNHVNGYYQVAKGFATAVVESQTTLSQMAGSCATQSSLSDGCLNTFVKNFGLKTKRRPLNNEEVDELRNFAKDKGIHATFVRMLMTPEFLYRVEIAGASVNGREDLLSLSSYEIASRLSFHFWDDMPDQVLFNGAANGTILTNYSTYIDYAFNHPSTKGTVEKFYEEWLNYPNMPILDPLMSAKFAAFSEGLGLNQSGSKSSYRSAMIQEIQDLTNEVTWGESGTYEDLLMTRQSFTNSSELAGIYDVSTWTPGQAKVFFPAFQDRAGLLTRAAMITTGVQFTSPIRTGVFIRRKILCDVLPDPPNDLVIPELSGDLQMSTRETVSDITNSVTCQACHSKINNLGFAFEGFDALGRIQSTEKNYFDWVFNGNGDAVSASGSEALEFSVNNSTTPMVSDGDLSEVTGAVALSQKIADSGKGHACIPKLYLWTLSGRNHRCLQS